MKLCELCHKNEATGTIWLNPEQSPIKVGGRYQVCEKCGGPKKDKDKFYGGETI